jgi:cysteine-rich repeat protein/parallel beta-helix repeat protein
MMAGTNTTRGELIVRGRLAADGTPNQPITIGSTSSTAGTWYGIDLDATAQNVLLDNVIISRANTALTYRSTSTGNTITNTTADTPSSYGLLLRTGSPTLDGFRSIASGSYGIYITESSSPTLINCVVRNSISYGIYVSHTTAGRSVTLDNCTLNANGTYNFIANASAVNSASITITDSIVTNASYGVYRSDSSTLNVTNSNVWNNSSANYSGVSGGSGTISANPLYVSPNDLRLTSNSPSRFGATSNADQGAQPYDGVMTPGLYGTLWSNTSLAVSNSPYRLDGDLTVAPGVTLTIEAGTMLQFLANSDIMAAGTNTTRGELIVRGKIVADGTTAAPITIGSTSATSGTWYGVDLDTTAANSLLDHVTISRANTALTYRTTGAGNVISFVTADSPSSYGLLMRTGSPTIDAWATVGSGSYGMYITDSASPTFTNCIVRNSISYGIYVSHTTSGRSVALTNCTLNANGTYNFIANASAVNSATITITNSVITNASYGVYRSDSSTLSVTYSDVWNNSSANYSGVSGGTGTISANPQYASPSDLHLQGTSVAIDMGTTGPTHDADGIARPLDGNALNGAQYDMGAYEFVLMAQCGNGSVEPGELCDSGANNGMYGYCNASCTALGPRCGDGMMNGTEQCDDGNATNSDACLNTCVSATCGDGFVRVGTEQCDDGNGFNTDACTNQCMTATCGDGYVRAGMEACDDGNQSNTDACLTTCVAASCGDGYTYAGVEQCDDQNSINTDACLNTCVAASCGDGFMRSGVEACDDGNMIATDNCTATCTVATCGDGVVHAGVEECDDANQADTDACVASCKLAACGDGYIRAGVEVCDDGNLNNADGCSNMCVSTTCGDGVLQAETEECDDGNMVDTDACRYNCADAACGDGVVRDGVEDCDDGNVMAGDGCSPACKVEGTGSGSGSDIDPGTPDDGGGCCQTSGGVGGSWLLALIVLGMIRRRR